MSLPPVPPHFTNQLPLKENLSKTLDQFVVLASTLFSTSLNPHFDKLSIRPDAKPETVVPNAMKQPESQYL